MINELLKNYAAALYDMSGDAFQQEERIADAKRALLEKMKSSKPTFVKFTSDPNYSDMLNRYNLAHNDGYHLGIDMYEQEIIKLFGLEG